MISLGPLAFLTPWALAALLVLPAIWWLLRLTPPVPNKVVFPPIQLLFGLISKHETAAKTPWWLLLLRLLIAALIIFAAARPLLHADAEAGGDGPVVIVIDNGWAAADRWDVRRDIAVSIAERAARAGRQIVVLPTAAPADGGAITVQSLGPEEARDVLSKLSPNPGRQTAVLRRRPWLSGQKGSTGWLISAGYQMALMMPVQKYWASACVRWVD